MSDKTFIERVTDFTEGCEDVTEELTRSAGMVVTKITPLLAPVASGLCTLFAFYDGGGRMLTGKVDNPYGYSFAAGLILFAVIEGINFSATFTRDRSKAFADSVTKFIDLDRMVANCFWLTLCAIAMLETLPGVASWYKGEIAISDLFFRAGILILPFFSKMGANIFSASMIIDAIEGTTTARRQRRLQAKREVAELEIELQAKRDHANLKIEIERQRADKKLNGTVPRSVPNDVPNSAPKHSPQVYGTKNGTKNGTENGTKTEQRRNKIFETILDTGWQGVSSLVDVTGAGRTTIYRDLEAMEKSSRIKIDRAEDGTITNVDVSTGISLDLPTDAQFAVNGNGINHLV